MASTRVYQTDECYSVTMGRLIAQGRETRFQTDPGAFMIGLSRLSRGAARSEEIFATARRAMLALFWLNLILLAACTGERAPSRRWLIALLAAGSLAPLWDYGFEIRHDNLLLTGFLSTWLLLRVRPRGRRSYFAAGALAIAMQFVAFKAFVYMLPMSAAFLAFPPSEHRTPRRELIASWTAGAATALAIIHWTYSSLGLWPVYLDDLRRMSAAAAHVRRMLPWEATVRFAVEAPLLLRSAGTALSLVVRDLRRRGEAARTWDGKLPEAALVAGVLAALLVNPTPYAYNLLFLIPAAFLLVWRCADDLAEKYRERLRTAGWTFVILAHAAPFAAAICWESAWSNARQVELMGLAEALTGPSDPVLDGAGLVPTRPSVDSHWLLDTLNIRGFRDGSHPPMRDLVARNPAAVFIPNYRTDWLSAEDRDDIDRHYVSLSGDFRVLGAALPPSGGDFNALRAGRYWLSTNCASDANLTIDGARISPEAVSLTAGPHRLNAGASCRPSAIWIGPHLDLPPRLEWRSHRRVFIDWY